VDAILGGAMDIEELALQGSRRVACPYYASREAAAAADVVLVPYSCLIHRCAPRHSSTRHAPFPPSPDPHS